MTEQETIDRLKKDHSGIITSMEGKKLHYMVLEGKDLGFILREPSLGEFVKANAKLTSLSGGSLTEAGMILFDSCLIAGAIDDEITKNDRLLVSAYNVSSQIIGDDYGAKKN